MEILTEWDELLNAYSRVDLDEEVMPVIGGRLVENENAYCKAQKLLKCPAMNKCHQFILDCDFESLEPEEEDKINKLYDIGVKNNLIKDTLGGNVDGDELIQSQPKTECPACEQLPVDAPAETPNDVFGYREDRPSMEQDCPCFTILYSATKDGETRCGQCFSNSVSVAAAKADCLAKLAKFGYENIAVLGIEAGCAGGAEKLPSSEIKQNPDEKVEAPVNQDVEQPKSLSQDDLDAMVDEACFETKKEADEKMRDDMMKEAEEEFKIREFDAMMKEAAASKNPYAAGMKMFEDDGEAETPQEEKPKEEAPAEEPKEEAPAEEPKEEKPKEEAPAETPSDSGDDGGLDIPSFDMGDDNGGESGDAPAEDGDAPAEDGDAPAEDGDDNADDSGDSSAENSDDADAGVGEELSAEKKAELRDTYQKAFKDVLKNYPDKSYHDLTLDQQIEFMQKLKEGWDKPNAEVEFMSDKEIDQLYAVKDVPEEGAEDKPAEDASAEGSDEKPAENSEEKPEEEKKEDSDKGDEEKPEEEKKEDSDKGDEDKE